MEQVCGGRSFKRKQVNVAQVQVREAARCEEAKQGPGWAGELYTQVPFERQDYTHQGTSRSHFHV